MMTPIDENTPKDRELLLDEMREAIEISNGGDIEAAHTIADRVLCDALLLHGEDELVAMWDSIGKWYA